MYFSTHVVETKMDLEDEVAGIRAITEHITRGVWTDRLTEVDLDNALEALDSNLEKRRQLPGVFNGILAFLKSCPEPRTFLQLVLPTYHCTGVPLDYCFQLNRLILG